MQRDDRELRELLGLEADVELEQIGSLDAPRTEAGRGLALAETLDDDATAEMARTMQALADGRRPLGSVEPVPMAGIDPARCALMRMSGGLRAVVLEGEFEEPSCVRGDMYEGRGRIAIPSTGAKTVVRVRLQGGLAWVIVDEGAVQVMRVLTTPAAERDPGPRGAAEPTMTRPEPPAWDELPGARSQEAWLRDAVADKLGSDRYADRVAGVGLVARLWTRPRGADAGGVVDVLLAGERISPSSTVRRWARSLDRATVAELIAALASDTRSLSQRLAETSDSVSVGGVAAAAFVVDVAHRRDDLESLAAVLRVADAGEAADDELATLDREAVTHLTALSAVAGPGEDDRLRAVSWQEPDAWWGALAAADDS